MELIIYYKKQSFIVLIDDEDYNRIKMFKWVVRKYRNYYKIQSAFYNKKIKNTSYISLSRFILSASGKNDVDHIDGNVFNCCKYNLRICSHQENMFNQKKRINNTSGFKGVSFDKKRNKFRAYIVKNASQKFLGYYKNIEDAKEAYNKKAIELFGEFALLN